MLRDGKTVDDIKVEAFAVVREAAKRVLLITSLRCTVNWWPCTIRR